MVVRLRAGHHDAIGGHAVQLARFLTLRVIPDDHAIGDLVDQPLGGEVIPAADAQHRLDAGELRRPDVIDLV
jgi:hypothetical protein